MKDQSKIKQARSKSERGKAEQALKGSEESGWSILANIQEGYYEVDLAGNFTFFNPSMSKILGYAEEEMMGMNYRLYMDKENAEKIFHDFNEVYRTGVSSRVDYEQIKKDGSKMFVETSVALMRDSSGQPTGFQGIVRDITERRRMEEMLHESEERYRYMIENSSDLIQSVDHKGRIIFVNPAWREALGYTEEEVSGLHLSQIIHSDSMDHCQGIFRRIMSGHSVKNTQATFVSKSGRPIIVEGNLTPRMIAGQVIATHGFFRDITERKGAEEKIERLSRFPSENPNPVLRVSAQGILQYSNAASDALFPAMGTKVGGQVSAEWQARIDETLANKHPVNIEFQVGDRTFSATLTPVVEHGYLNLYAREITDRKRAEKELEDSRNMLIRSEKLAAIGQLSAGVAHEILNPVNIMAMKMQMLGMTEDLSEKTKDAIRVCENQIQRVTKITGDLQQFARVSERKITPSNINELTEQVFSLMMPRLKMEDVELDVRYQQDLPQVPLDRDRMGQVILNLINNALDAMKGRPKRLFRIITELTDNHVVP